eukprot:758405-Hanusia_phi.AAC.7
MIACLDLRRSDMRSCQSMSIIPEPQEETRINCLQSDVHGAGRLLLPLLLGYYYYSWAELLQLLRPDVRTNNTCPSSFDKGYRLVPGSAALYEKIAEDAKAGCCGLVSNCFNAQQQLRPRIT